MSEMEGEASLRRALLMLAKAHSRAEAEAATAAWQEHKRRYPHQTNKDAVSSIWSRSGEASH